MISHASFMIYIGPSNSDFVIINTLKINNY